MLRNLGWPEILIILVIVMIIFGVGKLPQVGSALGKGIREFTKARSGGNEKEEGEKDTKEAVKTETKEGS